MRSSEKKVFKILCLIVFLLGFMDIANAASTPMSTAPTAKSAATPAAEVAPPMVPAAGGVIAPPSGVDFEAELTPIEVFYDPYEKYNRVIFKFNYFFNNIIVRPFAEIYAAVLPNVVQKSVNNFFSNMAEAPRFANDILQADGIRAMNDMWRFIINTTAGIGGLFDVATHMGLERKTQDLGLTFAKWGAKNTPYFLLPILGPSTIRDTIGIVGDYEYLSLWPFINSDEWRYGLLVLGYIDIRANLLPADKVIKEAFDPYIAERNAYLQYRAHLISEYNL